MKLLAMSARGFVAAAVAATGLAVGAVPASAEVVSRDPSFGGGDGYLPADWDIGLDVATDVALQPDGKIVVAGWAQVGDSDDAEIIRLNPDGSPDESFGHLGEYWYDSGSWDRFQSVAVYPDGKIAAVGVAGGLLLVVRLNADGTPDTTFSEDGVVSDWPSGGADLLPFADGKLVVVRSMNDDVALMRFTSAGYRDVTFGEDNGMTLVDSGSTSSSYWWDHPAAVTQLTDGAFMVAATRSTNSFTGSPPTYSMAVRFTSDGRLDTAFNGVGYRWFDFDPGSETGLAVLPAAGGKAILGARGYNGDSALARLNPNGSLDTTFGNGGIRRDPIRLQSLARDNAGRIIAGGFGSKAQVKRFSANGTLDTTFNKGVYLADFSPNNEASGALAVQPDGKIVHVGHSWVELTDRDRRDADWFVERLRFSPDPPPAGYWMLEANGAVYPFGDATPFAYGHVESGTRAVDIEPTPSGAGAWVVNNVGTVFRYGTAKHYGDRPALAPGEEVTSMSSTKSGDGYWLFTSRGRALTYGNAVHYGDMVGVPLNGPVLGSVRTASGLGYYMVASDGGIFAFGDARFRGSMGGAPLNGPVVGLASDPDNVGYWLVADDGGVFAFDAPFRGSMGGKPLNKPVIGMVSYGNGYLMVGQDGGIFNFSSKAFVGSLGSNPPTFGITSVAAYPK